MRIAYVGNFEPEYSTENDVRKAFEHLGHEVIKLQEGDKFNPNKASFETVREVALSSDMLLWTGTWGDAYNLGDVLDLFHELALRKIPSATLHLDTFWGTSRGGRKWWLEPMFHTAYIFTADGDYQEEWKAFGKNHVWLPPAVRHDAVHFGKFREEYACDVGFAGSNGRGYHEDVWTYRKELVDNLRSMCQRNGWTFKNPGGDQEKISRNDDMNDFYASAKITVGDSLCLKKEDSHYWSDRVPEAIGRGGFLIMPRIKALNARDLPKDDVNGLFTHETMYDWGDWADLENKIKYWLDDYNNSNQSKYKLHTLAGLTRVEKYHTYVNRAQTIIETVGLA